jgi:hypothetical protein
LLRISLKFTDVLSNLSPNGKSICTGIMCFVLGGLTGGFLLSNSGNSSSANSSHAENTGAITTKQPRFGLDWGSQGTTKRPSPKSHVNRTDESMITVPISLLKSLSDSKSNHTMGQSILDDNDLVEAALGLTSVEKDRIKSDWQRACDDVRAIEINSLSSKDLEDGSVVMSLPDLSKPRKEIAEKFLNSVTQTLGSERAEAFYATKQIDNRFSADAGERSITVKVESAGDGQWSYQMSLQDASGSRVWLGESIPLEIRHLADAAGIRPAINNAVKSTPEE